MKLPIFPLPVFLLPQGITRLRIFEQRYLNMVKLATKAQGFAILSTATNAQKGERNLASWVDIINFDQDEQGVLVIDVKCKQLVTLSELIVDKDNLHHGDITHVEHWPERMHDDKTSHLSMSLLKVFEDNKLLTDMYQSGFKDNANWVIARWLELLPINLEDKMMFANQHSFKAAKQFVQNIVLPEK
ncbi:ATP-dependent protease [Thalassotalea sp. 1_MG-2023]|uniref:LON peptidase substrate-binding domain-containing protein n=1 Tax=Thalassotalea sp. 1_MG-2023 TaxID=3062680 RepID=UPI0026E3D143|nr:LON peptidase substrate-binding domain-containing protein [Thalassotalea sp. 1_MG-2023]MDO6427900.1 ATP-dependent protease [Thalassotalea sp. 1_MG-2023]